MTINKECFAYAEATDKFPERCSALEKFQCDDCNFFCHKNNFDKKKLAKDIANYAKRHSDNETKKYEVTREEVLEIISEA